MKRRRRKRKILTGITYAEGVILFMTIGAMDSPNPTIPIIILLQAMAWLGLFFWANPNWGQDKKRKGERNGQRTTQRF